MTEAITSSPFRVVDVHIALDEDFNNTFPLTEGDGPADMTGRVLEWYARPDFDSDELLLKLSTEGGNGIFIDMSSSETLISFLVRRADVNTYLPKGNWKQFLTMREAGSDDAYVEIWRGDLFVHPGKAT